MGKPRLLVATPEINMGLPEGQGNLGKYGINFSNGGMAPVNSSYVRELINAGDFDVHVAIPQWESSLRSLTRLGTNEIKRLRRLIPSNYHPMRDAAFNRTAIKGTNVMLYDNTRRYSVVDRAIAFSRGLANYVIPDVEPDIVWFADWMGGPAAVAAKAEGIKIVTTGHNIITHTAPLDRIVNNGIDIRDYEDSKPSQWIWWKNGEVDFLASSISASDDYTTVSEGFLKRQLDGFFDNHPAVSSSGIQAVKQKAAQTRPDGRPRVHGYLNPLEKDVSYLIGSVESMGLESTIAMRKQNATRIREITGLRAGGYLGIFTNRLYTFQKRADFFLDHVLEIARQYDLRVLICANGDPDLVNRATELALHSDGLVAYWAFDKSLEDLAKVSHDSFSIMTSDFEPSGGQNVNHPLEGTLVVGHAVDGIRDSVIELDVHNNTGTGFPYEHNDVGGLHYAIGSFVRFAQLPDSIRYDQYMRIAREFLQVHSAKAKVRRLTDEVFLPLVAEQR